MFGRHKTNISYEPHCKDNIIAWKSPITNIDKSTLITVPIGYIAILYYKNQRLSNFESCKDLPVLKTLKGDGFKVEAGDNFCVIFIKKKDSFLDMDWGTPYPALVKDAEGAFCIRGNGNAQLVIKEPIKMFERFPQRLRDKSDGNTITFSVASALLSDAIRSIATEEITKAFNLYGIFGIASKSSEIAQNINIYLTNEDGTLRKFGFEIKDVVVRVVQPCDPPDDEEAEFIKRWDKK